jgi:RNA polymerase sigma-70 factor (ECF subfamily)
MTASELRDRAIDQAYRDHSPDVYRVAYGILRDVDEAHDATQDAFARAWERWDQYDDHRPLRGWLHGIVVHLALDRLRRRRVRRQVTPRSGPTLLRDGAAGSNPDPSAEVVRRRIVDDALGTLRPEARAALVLRHYYGYDYASIGAFLGLTAGSVGSILSRSHAALRERLAGDAPSERAPTALPIRPADPPEVLR